MRRGLEWETRVPTLAPSADLYPVTKLGVRPLGQCGSWLRPTPGPPGLLASIRRTMLPPRIMSSSSGLRELPHTRICFRHCR